MGKKRIVGITTIVFIILSVVGATSYVVGQRAIELHDLNPVLVYALIPLLSTGQISITIFLFWPLKRKTGGNSNGS